MEVWENLGHIERDTRSSRDGLREMLGPFGLKKEREEVTGHFYTAYLINQVLPR